jgi:hypothetical protein
MGEAAAWRPGNGGGLSSGARGGGLSSGERRLGLACDLGATGRESGRRILEAGRRKSGPARVGERAGLAGNLRDHRLVELGATGVAAQAARLPGVGGRGRVRKMPGVF